MSVDVTKTAGGAAEITWEATDDPHGYIARAVEGDQLAFAIEALGDGEEITENADQLALAARHTTELAWLLERRAAVMVVHLRDRHGKSWRQIATTIHGDPEKQSTVRRQYDAGVRFLGRPLV